MGVLARAQAQDSRQSPTISQDTSNPQAKHCNWVLRATSLRRSERHPSTQKTQRGFKKRPGVELLLAQRTQQILP